MLPPEIMREVQSIELHVRKLMRGTRAGDSRAQLRGMGVNFHQIREYQQGDDVRFIDWKGTARTNKLLVKECFEDRNRQILLILDCSPSTFYGSLEHDKYTVMAQAASALAIAASWYQDSVGFVLLGGDEPVVWKGHSSKQSVYHLIEQLFAQQARSSSRESQQHIGRIVQQFGRDALAFVLSDMLDPTYNPMLKRLAQLYEVVAVRCLDRNERSMNLGTLLTMVDSEHGRQLQVTPSDLRDFQERFAYRLDEQERDMNRMGIDVVDISTASDFIKTLVEFLRTRVR